MTPAPRTRAHLPPGPLVPDSARTPPVLSAVLRVYARGLIWLGVAVLAAGWLRWPPDGRGYLAAVAGAVTVAALRFGAVNLSKFAYITMTVVPVGALTLLGHPVDRKSVV